MRPIGSVAGLFLLVCSCMAQEAPQLSPQAAYDAAMMPLQITRNSIANWSDAEQAALAVAMKQAGAECAARPPERFTGDDLISLARLCSFGQNWPAMGEAALRYINSNDPVKPQLGLAYAFNLNAKLQAKDVGAIAIAAQSMLAAVPYDAVADATYNAALRFLQLVYTDDALRLYAAREQVVLRELRSEKPTLARHLLYEDGVAMAMLLQYVKAPEQASETVAALDQALGDAAKLGPDEALPIADARRQYGLLGKPLPKLRLELSLYDITETPRIDENYGDATALLLFPDWCAQCTRSGPALLQAMHRVADHGDRLYALMAGEMPDRTTLETARALPGRAGRVAARTAEDKAGAPKTAAQLLLHTPALVVAPETLHTFVADDFPFLIVLDHAGIVRFLGVANETALQPKDFVDEVLEDVAERWPRLKIGAR